MTEYRKDKDPARRLGYDGQTLSRGVCLRGLVKGPGLGKEYFQILLGDEAVEDALASWQPPAAAAMASEFDITSQFGPVVVFERVLGQGLVWESFFSSYVSGNLACEEALTEPEPPPAQMEDERFWAIIETLGGVIDRVTLDRLRETLTAESDANLLSFQATLVVLTRALVDVLWRQENLPRFRSVTDVALGYIGQGPAVVGAAQAGADIAVRADADEFAEDLLRVVPGLLELRGSMQEAAQADLLAEYLHGVPVYASVPTVDPGEILIPRFDRSGHGMAGPFSGALQKNHFYGGTYGVRSFSEPVEGGYLERVTLAFAESADDAAAQVIEKLWRDRETSPRHVEVYDTHWYQLGSHHTAFEIKRRSRASVSDYIARYFEATR